MRIEQAVQGNAARTMPPVHTERLTHLSEEKSMAASRKSSDRERNSAKSAAPKGGGRSRKTSPGSKDPKRTSNPLTHIRFGSAGSGGAEFEPIRGSSKKRGR
jgi:hypothetical protein